MNYSSTKCAVFCLLALSGFKMIFAEKFDDDLIKMTGKFMDQMINILTKHFSDIDTQGEAVGLHTKEFRHPGGCTESSRNAMDRFYNLTMDMYDPCSNKAEKKRDLEFYQTCSGSAVSETNKDIQIVQGATKTCLQKCTKKTPDCDKEIKNLDGLATKKLKNAVNSGTKAY